MPACWVQARANQLIVPELRSSASDGCLTAGCAQTYLVPDDEGTALQAAPLQANLPGEGDNPSRVRRGCYLEPLHRNNQMARSLQRRCAGAVLHSPKPSSELCAAASLSPLHKCLPQVLPSATSASSFAVTVQSFASPANTSWSSHLQNLVAPQCTLHSFIAGQVSAAQHD